MSNTVMEKLNDLQEKISNMVLLTERLTAENTEMKQELERLREDLLQKEEACRKFEEEKNMIKNRIETILEKLHLV